MPANSGSFLNSYKKSGVMALVLLFTFMAFYLLVSHFNYNWTWSKVPQYFFYHHQELVTTEQEGTIKFVDGGNTVQVVGPDNSVKNFELLSSQRRVRDGEKVFVGDALGAIESWKVGPLIEGLWVTLKLSFYSTILGLILGVFCGLGRISTNPILSSFSLIYVEAIRGTPVLVQLFIIYFMFGSVVGIESRFLSGVLALGIFSGAYVGEILRSGIESIHHGQMEAARSLGMTQWQAMTHVIMPQVFKQTLPALAGTFISLIKDSSLVSVMALTDLTKAGREIVSSSFMVFEIWITVAALYFLLTSVFSHLFKRIERRLSLGGQR